MVSRKDNKVLTSPGHVASRWSLWRGCPAILVLLSLLIMAKIFFIDWGLLEMDKYLHYPGCNESVFNINCDRCYCDEDKLADDYLTQKCFESTPNGTDRFKSGRTQRLKYFSSVSSDPYVYTKCGKVQSRLVSKQRKVQHKKEVLNHSIKVPNIVHYVSLGNWKFTFLNYLSFKSVHRFIKPRLILIHGDSLPHGDWWEKILNEVPNIYFARRDRPIRIQGVRVPWIEHSSDIVRLQTIYGKLS